jgi:hypothetical protein
MHYYFGFRGEFSLYGPFTSCGTCHFASQQVVNQTAKQVQLSNHIYCYEDNDSDMSCRRRRIISGMLHQSLQFLRLATIISTNRSTLIYETLRGSAYALGSALFRTDNGFVDEEASRYSCIKRRELIRTLFWHTFRTARACVPIMFVS